jgi:hypothetical protein
MTHLRRLDEQFPLNARDPIRREVRKLLGVLEARLAAYDRLQVSYDAVVEEARLVGLARINETLTPVVQDALDKLHNVTKLFTARSETEFTLATGESQFEIGFEDRALFVPLDFVLIALTSDPNTWAYGRVTSFDRASGILLVTVLTLSGAGSYSDWTIQASPPLDVGHAARTDNPHETTAAQVGAYTIAQVDQAIEAAVNSIVAGASQALDTLSEIETWINATNTAIANRLRLDADGGYTTQQKAYGRSNLGSTSVGDAVLTAASPGAAAQAIGARPARNLLINPAMMVDQAYAGTQVYAAVAYLGRWVVDNFLLSAASDATFNHQRANWMSPAGSPNRAQVSITAADTNLGAAQHNKFETYIEGLDFASLKWGTAEAKPILVRIGVRAPMSGNFYVSLRNGAENRSYIHKLVVSANTDHVFYFVVPGDTAGTWASDNTTGLKLALILAAGSNFHTINADLWQGGQFYCVADQSNGVGTVSTNWYFFDWAVYDATGMVSGHYPEFEVPDYQTERRRCMRYYEHSWNDGTPYRTLTGVGAVYASVGTSGIAGISLACTIPFQVSKRVSPSMISLSPVTGNNNYARDLNYAVDIVLSTTGYVNHATYSAASQEVNAQSLQWHWCASARLT